VLVPRAFRYIVGGEVAGELSQPWRVAVGTMRTRDQANPWRQQEDFFCAGSLVSNRHVVTAAHCVASLGMDPVLLMATNNIKDGTGVRRGVSRVTVHPDWMNISGFPQNDIAVLELDAAVEFSEALEPVCLPPRDFPVENRQGTVAGWGRLYSGGPATNTLLTTQVSILRQRKCAEVYGNLFSRNIGLLCARGSDLAKGEKAVGQETVTDSCQGDSGSGLVVEDDGHAYLAGIVTGGISCGLREYPGIYNSLSFHANWVQQTMLL